MGVDLVQCGVEVQGVQPHEDRDHQASAARYSVSTVDQRALQADILRLKLQKCVRLKCLIYYSTLENLKCTFNEVDKACKVLPAKDS